MKRFIRTPATLRMSRQGSRDCLYIWIAVANDADVAVTLVPKCARYDDDGDHNAVRDFKLYLQSRVMIMDKRSLILTSSPQFIAYALHRTKLHPLIVFAGLVVFARHCNLRCHPGTNSTHRKLPLPRPLTTLFPSSLVVPNFSGNASLETARHASIVRSSTNDRPYNPCIEFNVQ